MASTYPSTIGSLNNPNPTDRLNNPSHSALHQNENSEIVALETFVGTLSSTQGTLMYDVRAAASSGGGHVQAANVGGTGQTSYTKGDVLVASSSSVLTKLAVGADNQVLTANSSVATGVSWTSGGKFGGSGTDGALALSVGATNINLGSSVLLVKNYTSISITGSGQLTFTNPNINGTTIVLKSQGGVTLSSSATPNIAASILGGAGGASVASGNNYSGNIGNPGYGPALLKTFPGSPGLSSGTGGGAGSVVALNTANTLLNVYTSKYSFAVPGAGGASGGSQTGTGSFGSGTGGNGGGALIIECGGAWNSTAASIVSVAGSNGGNASILTSGNTGSGGGGGGGAGVFIGLYNSYVSSVGTIVITAGTGGSEAGAANSGTGGGGATGLKGAGTNGGLNPGTGGAGGAGYSLLTQNTDIS